MREGEGEREERMGRKKERTEKKRFKALRKGSLPSTAKGHDLSYQNGPELANLPHRFSEKCWG